MTHFLLLGRQITIVGPRRSSSGNGSVDFSSRVAAYPQIEQKNSSALDLPLLSQNFHLPVACRQHEDFLDEIFLLYDHIEELPVRQRQ